MEKKGGIREGKMKGEFLSPINVFNPAPPVSTQQWRRHEWAHNRRLGFSRF